MSALNNLTIRPFHSGDQAAARSLILAGLGEHFGFIDESLNPDLDDIEASYVREGHAFVVAVAGAEIAGTAALVTETAGVGRLVRLSVAPPFRRRGLGRALIDHLADLARSRHLTCLVVETNRDWYPALRLYLASGFTVYSTGPESVHLSLTLADA